MSNNKEVGCGAWEVFPAGFTSEEYSWAYYDRVHLEVPIYKKSVLSPIWVDNRVIMVMNTYLSPSNTRRYKQKHENIPKTKQKSE